MADGDTHKRVAVNNERTMNRLLTPNITGGIPSTGDHPWIAVIAYYTVYHLIEEVVSIVEPDVHLQNHDAQVEFLRKTPELREMAFLYNQLDVLRKYALFRPAVNASFKTEQQILGYASAEHFRFVVLESWFIPLKNKLTEYRHSRLSLKSP